MNASEIMVHVVMGGIVLGAVWDLLRRLKKPLAGAPRQESAGRLLVSYRTLRRVIGVLGVSLPVVLLVLGSLTARRLEVADSISDYYHLHTHLVGARDVFVGVLWGIAWFMFAYKGYDPADDRAGDWACAFALGVALFPTGHAGWQGIAHPWSAAGLFLVLAYFSYFLFTKSASEPSLQSPEKRTRNRVYRVCGVLMITFVGAIGVSYLPYFEGARVGYNVVFWMESAALWAFGASWFVKGETLWRDPSAKMNLEQARRRDAV